MTNALRGTFTVKLGGDLELPCVLNLHAIGVVLEEQSITLAQFQEGLQDNPVKMLPLFVWAGVRTAAILDDREVELAWPKFSALFGSADWADITQKVGLAMALDEPKKKTVRAAAKP